MKQHEISILFDEETGYLKLKLDGSPIKIAKAFFELINEGDTSAKIFLAHLGSIAKTANSKQFHDISE